jgi:hypothetical protein
MTLRKQDKYVLEMLDKQDQKNKQFVLDILEKTIELYNEHGPEKAINFVKNVKYNIENIDDLMEEYGLG